MRLRVLLLVASLLTATSIGVAATTAANARTAGTVSSRTLLNQLLLAPRHTNGYAPQKFGESTKTDTNGCDVASRVLLAEATVAPQLDATCTLTGGSWVSDYDGRTVTDPSALAVDHLVPLSEAWQSGAWRWSAATRDAYSDDLGYAPSLLAVSTSSLQARQTRHSQTWLPRNNAFACTYLAWWVAVKWRWQLAVDRSEHDFLSDKLASCAWPGVALTTHPSITSVLCQDFEHADVTDPSGYHYQLLNIRYHARSRMCIQNSRNLDNFAVTREPGADPAGKVGAFPEIFRGCLWNGCSVNSGMPLRVSAIRSPVSTWHAREAASGSWNAAYELWFGKRSMITGQADGAELMIWLNLHGACCHLQRHAPKITIDGHRFWVSHWRPCSRKWHVCFNYIQFRIVHRTSRITNLRLKPFIARAIRMKLIKRWWWLENIGAGFEIWKGGRGLATTRFSVRMR